MKKIAALLFGLIVLSASHAESLDLCTKDFDIEQSFIHLQKSKPTRSKYVSYKLGVPKFYEGREFVAAILYLGFEKPSETIGMITRLGKFDIRVPLEVYEGTEMLWSEVHVKKRHEEITFEIIYSPSSALSTVNGDPFCSARDFLSVKHNQ